MKKLLPKAEGFSGKSIFFRQNGTFSILENSPSLPEGFSSGAEIPTEEGTYFVISSVGSFVVRVVGVQVLITSFLVTDNNTTTQKVFSYEDSTLTELPEYGTPFAGEYRISRTTDGGFALAGFPSGSNLLHLVKEGSEGNYYQTTDVSGLVGAQTFQPNGSRNVLGIVTSETGWYIHVFNSSTTTGVKPSFLIYVGFDAQNNNYIYTGRNHTLGTIPGETYTSFSYGSRLIASNDGGLILLTGRPYNGHYLVKFDSNLNLLYHSGDLSTRPGYVGEDSSTIELDIFLMSVITDGDGKYYSAGVSDILDGTYVAIDFMIEVEDNGTALVDNGYSEILAVPAINAGNGYTDITDGFYSGGKIYWCGTIYDNPEASSSDYGRVLVKVDAVTKNIDFIVRDYTNTSVGLNDLYHMFVLNGEIYVTGYVGDTSVPRDHIYVYSEDTGDFIRSLFPSQYAPTLSSENTILSF